MPSPRPVRTRIAPSPTGMMHIGTARTALFNYLYAKHCGGEYLVRIEDTDHERSTQAATDVIQEGLSWLGLEPDAPWVLQSENIANHKAAALQLLQEGKAYECFCTPEELDAMREAQKQDGENPKYDGRHRNLTEEQKAEFRAQGRTPTIRLKIPTEGHTVWQDAVQGEIRYPNAELDDFIILRSDGTPVYNLAVVVDDRDMGITHVIRGDDHINNTPKQILLYNALGAEVPVFAHVPLIHGDDGKKLSKRHGAVSVLDFKNQGYLPQAVCNYLLRLGWSNGDEEIISRERAIEVFDIHAANKGAAVFNTEKLDWLNAHYMRELPHEELLNHLLPFFAEKGFPTVSETAKARLLKGLGELKLRAKRLTDLAEAATFYLMENAPAPVDEKAIATLTEEGKAYLNRLAEGLQSVNPEDWTHEKLDILLKTFCTDHGLKFPQVAMPLRVALTGTTNAPSVTGLLEAFGQEESLRRIKI